MNKPTQKVRAGQPMTADVFALHRVDTQHMTDSHARMVAGKYEQRPMPIDVAEADAYDLRGKDYDDEYDAGIDWVIYAVAACIVALVGFGTYITWI